MRLVKPTIVHDGPTGILTLTDDIGTTDFLPNCDLDAARDLLVEFQELKDSQGVALKDNYRVGPRNWYPAMVSNLFWYVFLPWVKYRPLAENALFHGAKYDFSSRGNFGGLISILEGLPHGGWKARLHEFLWRLGNRINVRRHHADLLFFRFALKDFRSVEIRATLKQLGVKTLEAVPANSILSILQSLWEGQPHYFFPQPNKRIHGNRFRREYELDDSDRARRALFTAAIRYMETTLTTCVLEEKEHRRMLKISGVRAFYGFDDVNTYFYSLFFAAKSLGLPTLGHQHGAYVKRHAGYMMEGIVPADLEWYDHVIVWGNYWREKMIREAPVHPPGRWIVGASKLKISYDKTTEEGSPRIPSNVLIPYEFLADTASVGRYISCLVELGYKVWFRARVDEDPAAQLDAYLLAPEIRDKVRMATGPLDENFLAGIDIIAGTMTTLIYELLPAEKIIWYLDTPYRHLYDLVEERLAHLIRLPDLRPPGQMPPELLTPTRIPADELFGNECLMETLGKHLVPLLN